VGTRVEKSVKRRKGFPPASTSATARTGAEKILRIAGNPLVPSHPRKSHSIDGLPFPAGTSSFGPLGLLRHVGFGECPKINRQDKRFPMLQIDCIARSKRDEKTPLPASLPGAGTLDRRFNSNGESTETSSEGSSSRNCRRVRSANMGGIFLDE